jgi:hypothetical protein
VRTPVGVEKLSGVFWAENAVSNLLIRRSSNPAKLTEITGLVPSQHPSLLTPATSPRRRAQANSYGPKRDSYRVLGLYSRAGERKCDALTYCYFSSCLRSPFSPNCLCSIRMHMSRIVPKSVQRLGMGWLQIGIAQRRDFAPGLPLKATGQLHRNEAPQNCTCGIYAAKTAAHWIPSCGSGNCGEVYLWGTVIEHSLGWRAQTFARSSKLIRWRRFPSRALFWKDDARSFDSVPTRWAS